MGDSTGGFVWATMIGRLRRRAREFLFPVTSGLKPTRLDDSLHGGPSSVRCSPTERRTPERGDVSGGGQRLVTGAAVVVVVATGCGGAGAGDPPDRPVLSGGQPRGQRGGDRRNRSARAADRDGGSVRGG